MPLASVTNMPKHFGKTIKVYEYVPLLDDRNSNDQGLDAAGASYDDGNLYGSSKDIGTITSKLPTLTENGGRVNRVGFTRLQREGTIAKFGFFTEFTQEALDFDSDDQLMEHLSRELMNGAVQLTEAVLQRDLLAAAGVVIYAGAATSNGTMTGEGATPSLVEYEDLMRLDQTLTDNRTPKQTTVITGSRLVDTKTIPAARVLFIGSELVPVVKGMTDLFDNAAFIPVQHYASAGTVLNGEIGTVDAFRIVVVPEMLHWADVGAAESTNPGYRATGGNYDVFPMLCVGEDSFTTIGFQTDGKTVKFSVLTKMPGRETATATDDPYGETGFSSIKWYYGFLAKRPERIGLIKTIAPV
jgi:N4-gp56 family major capsid protein